MQSHYALDKTNAKLMGVCAGFANYSGIDPLGVRLLAVALTFFLLGPVAVRRLCAARLVGAPGLIMITALTRRLLIGIQMLIARREVRPAHRATQLRQVR